MSANLLKDRALLLRCDGDILCLKLRDQCTNSSAPQLLGSCQRVGDILEKRQDGGKDQREDLLDETELSLQERHSSQADDLPDHRCGVLWCQASNVELEQSIEQLAVQCRRDDLQLTPRRGDGLEYGNPVFNFRRFLAMNSAARNPP